MARGRVGFRMVVSSTIDADAQAFITAAAITDSTQKSAINTLVTSLKSSGVWTKMKAIYPFVGGNATSHKFNLKDPRDDNAAFRLSFLGGGWTHSSTGALPNGTSSYANTFLNGTNLTTNNTHFSYYSRTQSSQALNIEMGADKSPNANQILSLAIARSSGNSSAAHTSQVLNTSIAIATGQTSSQGLFVNNRNGSNASDLKIIRNGIVLATASTNGTNNVSNIINIYIGALNNDGIGPNFFSNKETAFATIGDGLTDTEASNLYTAVQVYETSLNRQV
jgi:hypothetical protein